jgi:hypothetical protein
MKRSGLTGINNLLSNMNAANSSGLYSGIASDQSFFFHEYALSGGASLNTLAVFRDPSAWYHLIIAYDTTQATASNRFKLYVNGIQATLAGSYPTQNLDGFWNRAVYSTIGNQGAVNANYFNGYLADIHFIDGQALDPTSFGEFSATTGVWMPKAYSGGSYGTNGFHLDFADNSTAAALGTDTSGNGNNWTPSNFSVSTTSVSSIVSGGGGNLANAVDNSEATFCAVSVGSPLVFDFSSIGGVSYSSSVVVRVNTGTGSPMAFNVNGAGYGSYSIYNGEQDVTVVSGSGTLNTLAIAVNAGGGANFHALKFNGNIFVIGPAGNDSLVDVPTNGSEVDTGSGGQVRGNYCTLNPLTSLGGTYSQGNLRFVGPSAYRRSNGTVAVSTGKWYWEVTLENDPYLPRSNTTQWNAFGFGVSSVSQSTTSLGSVTDAVILNDSGYYKNFSGSVTDVGTAFSSGDVLSCAVDLDANTFTFRRNNTQVATGTIGGTAGRELAPIIISYDSQYGVMDCNFGQRPFAYTAPSGFKALCTANLPAPVITKPSTVMDVKLYTGNSSTQSISNINFSPDFVWIKCRNSSVPSHCLFDTIRGATKGLHSNETVAEWTAASTLTAFNSDGFSLGNDGFVNDSARTYAAWTWDAGSSTVTNTQGSITSQVRANASAGFSIVSWTGTGANGSIGHGLGVAPQMVFAKTRTKNDGWPVYHAGGGSNYQLFINQTDAAVGGTSYFNGAPTSTVVNLGNNSGSNQSGQPCIAYCWAPVSGYSSFGSFVGTTSQPFVYLGFRPKLVWIKFASGGANTSYTSWYMSDSVRDTDNPQSGTGVLWANRSDAEGKRGDGTTGGSFLDVDFLSNGFRVLDQTNVAELNFSGATYIYCAWAESPFQYARAR